MGTSRLHAQPLYAYTAIYFLRFYALINILVVIYIFFYSNLILLNEFPSLSFIAIELHKSQSTTMQYDQQ